MGHSETEDGRSPDCSVSLGGGMRQPGFRRATAIAVLVAMLTFPLFPAPAGASVSTSGCKNTVFPGAELGWYPAQAGGPSALRIACYWDSRAASSTVSS